jgi:NADPH-dependent 2,4-dienoyl-CoA reductase/sulfur reductase-like enzyme
MVDQPVDVAVIGGGPAGLAAAIKAREAGAERVTIIERSESLGGLLDQCIHTGFGLFYFREDLTGPEYAHRFIERATDLGVKTQLETMVLDITSDRKITATGKDGMVALEARAIVLAMGCRERTRESVMIPGTRPAGILTAGTAQRYVNVDGFIPGKDIVILGSGDIGMIMARRLAMEGTNVKAVVEILPYVGGLIRNEVQCLYDFDIPVFLEHTVVEVHGRQRVEGVTIAKLDKSQELMPGTERLIGCDTLLLSVGLIPENEVSLAAGVKLNPLTGGPIVDDRRETSIPGIFAAGNVVHVHDLVDNVTWEGELAGVFAAEYAMAKAVPVKRRITMEVGENIRYVVPNHICPEREVTIYVRVKEPQEKVSIKVGDITTKSYRAVKPSEMIKLELSRNELGKIKEGVKTLIVNCQKRGREDDKGTGNYLHYVSDGLSGEGGR